MAGSEIYSLTLAAKLLSPRLKYTEMQITCDGVSRSVKTPLVLVSNQASLGGDFKTAPHTQNSDGTFNVSCFYSRKAPKFYTSVSGHEAGQRFGE